MPAPIARVRDARGFTLVEVLVASAILLTSIFGILSLLDTANDATHRTKVRDGATNLGRELIEAARAVPYPDLQATTVVPQLQAQPGLEDVTGDSTWHVRRRNLEYTITASVCSVDGAADGYGGHGGGSFCADSTATGGSDTDPEDYKRVAVVVSWAERGEPVQVRQEAVINDPGSAFAPSVIAMSASATKVIDPTVGAIAFSPIATSTRAESVRWYVDNVQRGTATGSNKSWQFTWDLSGFLDGVYQVRAQAYDRYGQTGAGYVVTVVLNRFAPAAPAGVTGGRNERWGNLVELEWTPNPERDVTTYEVYRVTGGTADPATDVKVCSNPVNAANATTCLDANAPSANQSYYVVALAPPRDTSSTVDRSAIGTIVQTDVGNQPPTAPGSITAAQLTGGGVELTWTAASDPEGQPLRYYRIYRDDALLTTRVDRTDSGSTLVWTDDSPTAASHRYWVTAVDDRLAESPLSPDGGIQP